ncbi:uncharacterized protein EDB93DRAFT_1104084 [Suillus bovinus]|uniref:uncharacterized protein n=1 Tax=Suillus bovinus TaxID=48563 RepID=UPI001B868D7E|nr:uncharacterized protein EDB93DRAFT_1104084 [Suillus bovinus]KAG2147406.1 hypothetical protein EDB93DRAFT_1104084 [Suillus bovinus]
MAIQRGYRALVKNMTAWYAKEGNAARERTDAPINHTPDVSRRTILVCKRQSHLTLGIIVIVAIGQGSVSVKFVIGIEVKYREILLGRFDSFGIVLHEEADKRAHLPLPRASDSRLIMKHKRKTWT